MLCFPAETLHSPSLRLETAAATSCRLEPEDWPSELWSVWCNSSFFLDCFHVTGVAFKQSSQRLHFDLQERDVREGADMLMVKPGLPYLDIVREVKDKVCSQIPLNAACLAEEMSW